MPCIWFYCVLMKHWVPNTYQPMPVYLPSWLNLTFIDFLIALLYIWKIHVNNICYALNDVVQCYTATRVTCCKLRLQRLISNSSLSLGPFIAQFASITMVPISSWPLTMFSSSMLALSMNSSFRYAQSGQNDYTMLKSSFCQITAIVCF